MKSRPALVALALFAGAALIAGFTMLRGIDLFDEGLVLQAARRVAAGQTPYSDFAWSYGPAQPYFLGALFDLFGTSLLGWRVLRVLIVGATALAVFALTRRLAGTPAALVAWLAAACALAQPANASPFPAALLLGLLALLVASREAAGTREALGAGLLAGLAATWRLDFGLYALAAAVAALAFAAATPRRRLALCGWCALAAALTTLVAYLPFAIVAGPGDLYEEVLGKSLRERDYWTLPFPLDYNGRLRAWPPGALAEDAKDALGFYLPLIVLLSLAVALVAAAVRLRSSRRLEPAAAGALVLGLGGASYLLSRTDEFHATPLLVAAVIPLAAIASRAWAGGRLARPLGVAAACLLALLLAYGAANRLSALLLPKPTAAIDLPAADGVRASPAQARSLEQVVRFVRARVPPGRPIFVAPRRSDLVAFENPMIYVLAERPNLLRDDVALRARRTDQRAVVRALERARLPLVVRWTEPLSSKREPNLRGRPNGVHTLDRYLARRYRVARRLPGYQLLERR